MSRERVAVCSVPPIRCPVLPIEAPVGQIGAMLERGGYSSFSFSLLLPLSAETVEEEQKSRIMCDIQMLSMDNSRDWDWGLGGEKFFLQRCSLVL